MKALNFMNDKYTLKTQLEDMDLVLIHHHISRSYWAAGIPFDVLHKALKNSLCFGLFLDAEQVAFARMVTDRATFAYLADVFVVPEHRSKGISKRLMQAIVEHPDLQGLRRMMLATRDAHGLYEQFGFTALQNPDMMMENWVPDIYAKPKARA